MWHGMVPLMKSWCGQCGQPPDTHNFFPLHCTMLRTLWSSRVESRVGCRLSIPGCNRRRPLSPETTAYWGPLWSPLCAPLCAMHVPLNWAALAETLILMGVSWHACPTLNTSWALAWYLRMRELSTSAQLWFHMNFGMGFYLGINIYWYWTVSKALW